MKQITSQGKQVSLSVRVPEDIAERFRAACERDYRSMSAELRRLIEQRVELDAAEHGDRVA